MFGSRPQPGLYPQLPLGQQPVHPIQPGAIQPYNPAAVSSQSTTSFDPIQQGLFSPQTSQYSTQGPSNPVIPYSNPVQAVGTYSNPQQQIALQRQPLPMAYNQVQSAPQGQLQQQSSQLQPSTQSSNQIGTNYGGSSYNPPPASMPPAPQPLEYPNKNEDPAYGPLGRAQGKIDRAIKEDETISPDLSDLLRNSNGQPMYVQPKSDSYKPFRINKTTALPDALHTEIRSTKENAGMGIFEDIERAWFTINNKLFLWDYNDGRDFSRYDEQSETIQSVGLVKAKRDVFVDEITHILVICTSSKVTLLGISRTSPREINMYATEISVSTPTPMTSVHGTATGRIFMLGQNKHVYELGYGPASSTSFWTSSTATLKCHTEGQFWAWVPMVAASTGVVKSITVDAQRQRLYTLGMNGEIGLVDVSGTDWVGKGEYNDIKRQGGEVAMLAVIGGEESRSTCLVAICVNGTRVYFEYVDRGRFGPSSIHPYPFSNPLRLANKSFYSSGTLFGVQLGQDASSPTDLFITLRNAGRQSALRENSSNYEQPVYQDWILQESIPSQVWTIVELPASNPAFSARRTPSGIALNPLSCQATIGPRQFLILTPSGLLSASIPRPVDVLSAEIEMDKDTAISNSRLNYGYVQTTAMGILLGASSDVNTSDISSAINTILLSAGAPYIRDYNSSKSIVYSPRHDGLALILSRFIRPIWALPVTTVSTQNGGSAHNLYCSQKTLLDVQSRLEGLRKFMEEYPFPQHLGEGEAKIAWAQEEHSLKGLLALITQTIEAISFMLLLADYKLPNIVARCQADMQEALGRLDWKSLLTSTQGREIAKQLVTSLIEQQIGQELGIDTLSELLQQRCGSFCQPGDVVLYKAEESLQRAESCRDPVARNDYLNESFRLFTKAAGSVSNARLQEVTKRYRSAGFTVGAIELPLKWASDIDPDDRASDFVKDGQHPSDQRKPLHDARLGCYNLVIEALIDLDEKLDKATAAGNSSDAEEQRAEAYALALASDDELFHFYLYDWHVARNLSEQLLDIETPYIEKYLQVTRNAVEERRDLLWKFYARRAEYLMASKALFELAMRNGKLPLNDRAYYLAQSLTAAKSAASVGDDDVEFASGLQERIDVAHVQMEVARAVRLQTDIPEDEKDKVLDRLDNEVLGLDELYQGFARPYRLYEPILLILKTADTRIDDVCQAVWRQLLQQAATADNQDQRGAGKDAKVGEAIRELMRRYFPSEAAPLDLVLPVIYAETSTIRGFPGWASEALLDGGVPLRDLWEAVTNYFEDSDDRAYYSEEIGLLAERWISSKEQIGAAEVERFASSYLLQTNTGEVDERTRQTRERMTAARNAAFPTRH